MPSRNSTLNQSAASLRDILEERNDQFEVLEPSKMYGDGQKNQMNKLNVQLRDYMGVLQKMSRNCSKVAENG